MKAKKEKLKVDYIGGEDSLTKFEEDALTVYFKKKKESKVKSKLSDSKK